jgi:phosphate transport system permease protein
MSDSGKVSAPGTLQLVSRATYIREWLLAALFFLCAFAFVLAVALIFVFVGIKAWPIVSEYGVAKFIFGGVWSAGTDSFGILPLIAGSFIVTLGALALGTPLAVGTAVFLSDVASPKVRALSLIHI